MRITGGAHRSRTLFSPKDNAVRPTSDKVRQAIFNMLNVRGFVQEANVLDAFCGTGALGLEALSQGASSSVFFDVSKETVELCKKNVQALGEGGRSQVFVQDASQVKMRPQTISPVTLIFLDPPYRQGLVEKAVLALQEKEWFSSEVCFVMETAKEEIISCPLINIISEKIYGDTKCLIGTLK